MFAFIFLGGVVIFRGLGWVILGANAGHNELAVGVFVGTSAEGLCGIVQLCYSVTHFPNGHIVHVIQHSSKILYKPERARSYRSPVAWA